MTELTIINGLKQNNKLVFDYVFNYYYSSLCHFAVRFTNDKTAAEDIVQDFFVKLWLEHSQINVTSSLKAYLFTAIKNKCIDFQKHQKVETKYKNKINLSSPQSELSLEYLYAETELRTIIEKSMLKLTPRCREIFEMSRFKGLSNQQIADSLNLSKRTVELQITNALKTLRIELSEFLPLIVIHFIFDTI